jgi:hypothetical protein
MLKSWLYLLHFYKSSKMAHFVFKCNKEDYLSLCYTFETGVCHVQDDNALFLLLIYFI